MRKKKNPTEDLWNGLAEIGTKSLPAWWRARCGPEGFALLERFLKATTETATWFPDPDDHTHHMDVGVHPVKDGKFLAKATAEGDAREITLGKSDITIHRLDIAAFGKAVAKALGLSIIKMPQPIGENVIKLGNMPSHGLVLYLVVPSHESDFSTAFAKIRLRDSSCLAILTPTRHSLTAEFRQLEDSGVVQHAALSDLLSLSPSGFSSVRFLSDYLSPGKEPSSRSSDDSRAILERIDQQMDQRFDKVEEGLANVGKHVMVLESENQMLKEKFANRMVALAQKVDTEFLNWIWAILANGSVSSAAKALNIPGSTFDAKVKAYAQRGGVYKTLYSITAIRRHGIGQKCIERYNEIFDEHQAKDVCSDPSAWKDVLDGLEAMNAKNWPKARQELLEIVQELVSET